jgi:hypothetical protein
MIDTPENVALAFLAALDEGRWLDAAALVDPRSREALQSWCTGEIEAALAHPSTSIPSDTHFVSLAGLIQVETANQAERLTSVEFLARFAEALHPATFYRRIAGGSSGEFRITRKILGTLPRGPEQAMVRYSTEWWEGGVRNEATSGTHSLDVTRTPEGWRILDADLGGWGGGHILPPPTDGA